MDKEKEEMASKMESLHDKIREDSSKHNEGNNELKRDNQKLLEQMEKERSDLEKRLSLEKLQLERKLQEDAKKVEKEKAEMEAKLAEEQEKLLNKMEKEENDKNEILQLYEKLQKELDKRKAEMDNLKVNLESEQQDLKQTISRGTSQIRELLEMEKRDRSTQFAEAQAEIDSIMAQAETDAQQIEMIQKVIQDVEYMAVTPLSVYFTAYRTEPYLGGGEEYLTFEGCSVNAGEAMDAKTGTFTAPCNAAYLFTLHVCTHDLKKALVAIRRNGIEVASIYDQVS